MPTDRYGVSCSDAIKEQFRREAERARAKAQYHGFARSCSWPLDELSRTPLEFGESRYELPELGLQVRFRVLGPLAIKFAVNEAHKHVFIMKFRFIGR